MHKFERERSDYTNNYLHIPKYYIHMSCEIGYMHLYRKTSYIHASELGGLRTPSCLLLASLSRSMMRVANSLALNRASFCLPWLRVEENSGLTGRNGTDCLSLTLVCGLFVAFQTKSTGT